MTQQTAVEQLITYMEENFHLTDESRIEFEKAKAMEKEQIINTYIEASENPALRLEDAEQYYNQTYQKE